MATRIRLRRMGSNKRPFYRVVVADQRSPRDGRFIENIGKYHPLDDPSSIEIDAERALHWLRVGAQPSDQVRNLMRKVGIWDTFVAERPGAERGVKPPRTDRPTKERPSKKEAAKTAAPEVAHDEGVAAREDETTVPTEVPEPEPSSEATAGSSEGSGEAGADAS
jgi:small subunit ribosomal protein S16